MEKKGFKLLGPVWDMSLNSCPLVQAELNAFGWSIAFELRIGTLYSIPDFLTVEAQTSELIPLHREPLCCLCVASTFQGFNSETQTSEQYNFTITPLSNSLSLYPSSLPISSLKRSG